MMPLLDKRNERRKYPRFKVIGDAFAGLGPRSDIVGLITDIGEGGLALRYIDGGELCDSASELEAFLSFEVSIVLARDGSYIDRLPFEMVMDRKTSNEKPCSSVDMRERRGRFGDLTAAQREQLDQFIRRHTTFYRPTTSSRVCSTRALSPER